MLGKFGGVGQIGGGVAAQVVPVFHEHKAGGFVVVVVGVEVELVLLEECESVAVEVKVGVLLGEGGEGRKSMKVKLSPAPGWRPRCQTCQGASGSWPGGKVTSPQYGSWYQENFPKENIQIPMGCLIDQKRAEWVGPAVLSESWKIYPRAYC